MKGKTILIISLLFLFSINPSFCKEKIVNLKEVQGRIIWIDTDKIAITYYSDEKSEEEILIFYDKDTKITHRKSIDEISKGDIVAVKYEEIIEDTDEGKKITLKAKEIIYIKKG